jgi:hypothetical protein
MISQTVTAVLKYELRREFGNIRARFGGEHARCAR